MKKIEAVLFDMDGVLIDAKDWHYDALNSALINLGFKNIYREEHLTIYDGLSTLQKLEKLEAKGLIKKSDFEIINKLKQDYTWEIGLEKINPLEIHIELMEKLKNMGCRMVVCSNSIRKTVELFISKAGLTKYMEFLLSNEDVKRKKPDPDIYLTAMERLNLLPEQCLILEDNFNGLEAARRSGGHILKIEKLEDVNINNVMARINELEK